MYNRKKINFYFLDERGSKLICVFISTILIVNIILFTEMLPIFPEKFHEFLDGIGRYITILGASFISIVTYYFSLLKVEKNEKDVTEYEQRTISRKNHLRHLKRITKENKIVILTGESGSGKTVLVEMLKKKYYIDNNYFNRWGENILKSKEKIIVLDQFERALLLPNVKRNIEEIKKSNKKILICVRKEFLANILQLLDFDRKIPLLYLSYNKQDIEEIENIYEEITGKTNEELKQHQFTTIINSAPLRL